MGLLAIPLASVVKVEVSQGHRSRFKSALKSAGIGFAILASTGVIVFVSKTRAAALVLASGRSLVASIHKSGQRIGNYCEMTVGTHRTSANGSGTRR